MEPPKKKEERECRIEVDIRSEYRQRLPDMAEKIIDSCNDESCYIHIDYDPIPSKESVIGIIDRFKEVLFPGYFSRGRIDPANLKYRMGQTVSLLFDILAEQIANSIRHDCFRYDNECIDCVERGQRIAFEIVEAVPRIRQILSTDVTAAYEGDPAAQSYDEVIFSYPGVFAVTIHRVANLLYKADVPLLPRIMSEYAHSVTGIDIHPGAEIGERFVIDHGTGVVIGETTRIGHGVRIYQGVTLGAHSLPKNAGEKLRGARRHPTIEDDVIIYSGATILGGETVIGARSIIGGNVWITKSVPPDTKVILEEPKLIYL